MLKKKVIVIIAILMSVALIAGCNNQTPAAEAPAAESPATEAPATETPTSSFTPAADLVPPPGKTLLALPVDQVADSPLRIATVMVQNNPFGAAVLVGQNYSKEVLSDRNTTVDAISVEDFDAQKWTSVIENCIATGYDAICFFGIGEALTPVTDKGIDAGIVMFAFNTWPGRDSKVMAWYGQSGFDGGAQCGAVLDELMGGEGKYAIITGDFAVLGHEERRLGARSVLDENSKLKLVGEFMNNDKAEEAYTHTTNLITANPDLKGLYVTAGGPSGAAKALEDLDMVDQVMLVCHDVLDASAPYVASGTIKACLDQDPFNQGYHPVIDAFNLLVAGIDPKFENYYEGVMATPETVKDLFPELF